MRPAVSAAVVVILLVVLGFWVRQDWRDFRRKGPLSLWFRRDPVTPDDPWYPVAFVQRFGFYIALLALPFLMAIAALLAWLSRAR